MLKSDDRKYWIVKHGLDAFELLPNVIWRTDKGPRSIPHRFNQVKAGDQWVAFAYTTSDYRERPLSLVTGFFQCTTEASFKHVPKGVPISDYFWKRKGYAWMIEGRACGKQPDQPVGVPPIDNLLGRPHFKAEAVVPITGREFDCIRAYTLSHQFDTTTIPLLGREPHNEQEVLSVVVGGYRRLGIDSIVEVQRHFPDLVVSINGREVLLELEVYSRGFFLHKHHKEVHKRNGKRHGKLRDGGEDVAVLCWIDDDKKVKDWVRVYELQSLIREGRKIVW